MDSDNLSPPVQSSVSRWRRFKPHLLAVLICVAMIAVYLWPNQRQVFIVYLLAVPALGLWGIVNLGLIVFRPKQRGWRTLNLVVVAATSMSLIAHSEFTTQRGREDARRDAEVVRKQVEAYRARTGAWPRDLSEVGADPEVVQRHGLGINTETEGVELHYRDNYDTGFLSVSGYIYNFKRGSWIRWRD